MMKDHKEGEGEMAEVSREEFLGKLFDGMQEKMAGADVSQQDIENLMGMLKNNLDEQAYGSL
jgi:hypothetical protein